MPTKQGDVSLLNDPIAQQLLTGPYPGHLAYVWTDGTPRVIPIGLTWDGKELVTGTPHNAPKMHALKDGDHVAVTYDTYTPPTRVLYIRGIVHLREFDGIVPEWAQAAERMNGKEGAAAFVGLVDTMLKAGVVKFIRLAIEPTWVGILDFERRFPSGIEKGLEALQALQK
jgi:hypothetical protein